MTHPIEIIEINALFDQAYGDPISMWTKGTVTPEAFCEATMRWYAQVAQPEDVRYSWWRWVPCTALRAERMGRIIQEGCDCRMMHQTNAKMGARGAFPVTYIDLQDAPR